MFEKLRRRVAKLGEVGENLAAEILSDMGMTILARNWRCRAGELDIVALDGDTIVFVEVKTTRWRRGFSPAVNLSANQRRRNSNAAKAYLRMLDISGFAGKFDLIEICFEGQRVKSILRHEDYLLPLPPRE